MRNQFERNLFDDDFQALNSEEAFLNAMEHPEEAHPRRVVTPSSLHLVNKKIPLRYCEFKITNNPDKMLRTDSVSISGLGLMLHAPVSFKEGNLMRILVELPDYWARKSRHVSYRHTDAPVWFQMLTRVVACEDIGKRVPKFQLLLETVNIDMTDDAVLSEYLGIEPLVRGE
jgi:hypothetical protein